MPRLILMRHAKSSWSDPAEPDHDRSLNARGRHAAERMADALFNRNYHPDTIICSTALRARKTLAPLLQRFDGTVQLTLTRALYEAQAHHYPALISTAAHKANAPEASSHTMLLIGHNYAIQDAALDLAFDDGSANYLALKNKFPTGAATVLDLDAGLSHIKSGSARLIDFLRPRDL